MSTKLLLTVGVLSGLIVTGTAFAQQPRGQSRQDGHYLVIMRGLTCPLCASNVTKQLRKVAGVNSVKMVDFKQGLFRVTPRPGVRLSENALMAAARRSGFRPERVVPPNTAVGSKSPDSSPSPVVTAAVAPELAPAREAFRLGRYQQARNLSRDIATRTVGLGQAEDDLRSAERNALIGEAQQLLSLSDFALGEYVAATAAAHAGLQRAHPWDWNALSGHYAKAAAYKAQLEALENSIRAEPTPEKRFLVGYHYLMLGQRTAARTQFAHAAKANPDDKLAAKLLQESAESSKE